VTTSLDLRGQAEIAASTLPALLAGAEHLATTVLLGDHGRRRAGMGDTFWQYRTAQAGDDLRSIDWRRSARADTNFVADKEWQIAQSVMIWVDQSASMSFASADNLPSKSTRARTAALATAILLIRGGERVGLTGETLPPRRGGSQITKLANILSQDETADYGTPETSGMLPHSRALFVSDFMGNIDAFETALLKAADLGVRGVMLQILDPQEETFPFNGRTIFQSMQGGLQHETLQAGDLKTRYLERLAERKDRLTHLARTTGWQFHTHHTNAPATSALLWLYQALARSV